MARTLALLALVAVSLSIAGCGGVGPASSTPANNRGIAGVPGDAKSESLVAADSFRPAASPREAAPAQRAPLPPTVSATGQFRSGTLTAGSLDDQTKFAEFSAYLSNAMQHDRREELPRFSVGRRAVVRVVNERGEPIGDARVTICATDSHALAAAGQQFAIGKAAALFETTTGADGQAVFLSGLDAPSGESEFVLSVTPGNSGQPVTQRVSLDQTPWLVTLQQAKRELPRQLDLALVIDTTGSMGDELNYLKAEIDKIAADVHERFPNVDQRFGLVLYRDQGDEYVTRSFDFTPSLAEFRRTLAAQSANGGGDYPEAMHLALEQSTQLAWRGAGTARIVFLVADAPPHVQFAQRTLDAVQKLRRQGVTVFPVASSGVREQAEFIMRVIGFLTQGKYLFLTDHSGVGDLHAKPQAASYLVEKLDQLMIRMIAEKLSGQTGLPQDVIAVEEPDQVSSVVPEVNPATAASRPHVPAQVFTAPAQFNGWGIAEIAACIGAAMLLIVVERVLSV